MTIKPRSKTRWKFMVTIRGAGWNRDESPLDPLAKEAVIKTLLDNLTLLAEATPGEETLHLLLEDERNLHLKREIAKLKTAPGTRGPKVKLLPRTVALMLVIAFQELTGSDMQPHNRESLQYVAWRVFKLLHIQADAKAAIEKSLQLAAPARSGN
jgi:hypothetical protein